MSVKNSLLKYSYVCQI